MKVTPLPVKNTAPANYVGPLRSYNDFFQSLRLVYQQYTKIGLMPENQAGLRLSLFELLPECHTCVVADRDRVVATGSLVKDSPAGLPMAHVFPEVYQTRKEAGVRIAEGTMFGCGLENKVSTHQILLISALLSHALEENLEELFVVVHPRHVEFWTRVVGFRVSKEARSCDHVEGSPGVLLSITVDPSHTNLTPIIKKALTTMKSQTFAPSRFTLDAHTVRMLTEAVPEILEKASAGQVAYLEQCYTASGLSTGNHPIVAQSWAQPPQ